MQFATMSALLLTIVGISAIQQCPMWKEIAPCTCRRDMKQGTSLTCDKMKSFNQTVELLSGHFTPSDTVSLRLEASNLTDLRFRKFKELNMTIESLKLNHDIIGEPQTVDYVSRWKGAHYCRPNLTKSRDGNESFPPSDINEEAFDGLYHVSYLSLADTPLERVPEELWRKMPNVKTVDFGRAKIKEIRETNFRDIPHLECLVLPGNQISRIDRNSFPKHIHRLHLGRNYIRDLNESVRHLTNLGWLFVNSNGLTSLEGQLPIDAPHLQLLHASGNLMKSLPQQLKTFPVLDSLFFQDNLLTSLDGAVAKSKNMLRLVLDYNYIDTIAEDEFQDLEMLDTLLLGHNRIRTLNNSLAPLRNLNFLNLTYNLLTEFSFQDIMGLQELRSMDLSFNQISTLVGPTTNMVEWNIKLTELKLDNNHLEALNGALSGFPELLRLNLSHNRLKRISPDDFIGLDQLRLLDISYNQLTTLEETSKTFLPRLSELKASHNFLTVLEKDFHGLPVLCNADLSSNQIVAFGRDLVTKTRCKIENGVYEGSWDTLKIYLQDNPILCDAALPEIMSAMEINHTRIYGVSHCPPLDEQPTTSKPNAFLGYLPEETLASKAAAASQQRPILYSKPAFDPKPHSDVDLLDTPNQIRINREPSVEYRLENEPVTVKKSTSYISDEPIALTLQKSSNINRISVDNTNDTDGNTRSTSNLTDNVGVAIDPVAQGQQITKLASEIEELRTRLDQLSTQNELLLNKTILERSTLTQRSAYEVDEARKP